MEFKKQSKNIKNILPGIRNKMLKKQCQETPFGSIEVKVPQSYKNYVKFSKNYVYPGSDVQRCSPTSTAQKEDSCPNSKALK